MAENAENIEAQLCAYIDGQLDSAQRQQIEQYLAANPEHRALIAEMMQQRQAIHDLPREAAPPDLMDNLQSQLERETLLDPDELSAPLRLAPNRLRQVLAIAAVLVLGAGLGVVVYSVLPPNHPSPVARVMEPVAEQSVAIAEPTPAPAAVAMKAAPAMPDEESVASRRAQDEPAKAEEAAPTLQVTVLAERPDQASEDVLKYLASNRIQFSMDYQPAPAAAPVTQEMVKDRSAGGVAKQELNAASQVEVGSHLQLKSHGLDASRVQRVIVARNVRGEQVAELTQSLSQSRAGTRVDLPPAPVLMPGRAVFQMAPQQAEAVPQTQPTSMPTVFGQTAEADSGRTLVAPTTQPATTQPAQVLNVVFLVQQADVPAATTQPATQPSTQPATQPADAPLTPGASSPE